MTLNEMNLISNDYFSKIAMKFDTKDKGRKDIEIDYYNMHAKGLLKHKKELQEIRDEGEKLLKDKNEQIAKEVARMTNELKDIKDEANQYEDEIIEANEMISTQNQIINQFDSTSHF